MTLQPIHEIDPTPFPDVNIVLGLVLANARSILGPHFMGMYLFGSLASGDFSPHSSDIDFVVLTDDDLPAELVARLKDMHAEIAASGMKWAKKLEGYYFPRYVLRRFEQWHLFPSIGADWDFDVTGQGPEGVIQRHILREQGIVLSGPPLADLIDPVSADQIRQATYQLLVGWWVPILTNPAYVTSSEYQAYAVLTMCRMLYTLTTGEIVSKPAAARWTIENHSRWADLIQSALAWQPGIEMDCLGEVLELIRYTVETNQPG